MSSSNEKKYLQKIKSLQQSVLFLQKEHSETLSGLYKEISKLQEQCSDLNFQLIQQQAQTNDKSNKNITGQRIDESSKSVRRQTNDDSSTNKQVQIYESSSAHTKSVKEQEKSIFSVQLESPDKRISLLEAQLKSKEQKFSCDLQNAQRIIASLQVEVENKSSSIAYLTTQLNKFMNLQGNNVEFSKPAVCPSPPLATPIRRRSSRNKVLSPSASLDGFIHEHYSQEIVTDYVLQNSLPKNNRVKLSSSLISKHSIDDLPSWHYQKLSGKPKPSDYEDFISMSQPNVVISKSSIQPLPPITTRSGKKLIEPTNAKKVLRNRPKATASACGEVEQIIKYNLAEKSCRNTKNSLMKH